MFKLRQARSQSWRSTRRFRNLPLEPLEERALLAVGDELSDGVLRIGADDQGRLYKEFNGDTVYYSIAPEFQGEEVSTITIGGQTDAQAIDFEDYDRSKFQATQLFEFANGPWVDLRGAQRIVEETLGPGWADKLGITDSEQYLIAGDWREPLTSGALAQQITDAGWGNAGGLLASIVDRVEAEALAHSITLVDPSAPDRLAFFNGKLHPAAEPSPTDELVASPFSGDEGEDPPAPPILAAGDATVTEPESGMTKEMVFTLVLSSSSTSATTFQWHTATNGSAESDVDFQAVTGGTGSFAAGTTATNVTVTINSDSEPEPDETFQILLTNLVNAQPGDTTGVGTILDMPTVYLESQSVVESGSSVQLTASLSVPPTAAIEVTWVTEQGSTPYFADEDVDYIGNSGTITFAPGQTVQTLGPIAINNDTAPEADEYFYVHLTGITSTQDAFIDLGSVQTPVVIINDDASTITLDPYEFDVVQNTPNGTLIGQVTADANLSPYYGEVRYLISGGLDSAYFTIDPITGEIYNSAILTAADTLTFDVIAYTTAGTLSDTNTVTVNVYAPTEIWREAENATQSIINTGNPLNVQVLQTIGDLTASGSRGIGAFTSGNSVAALDPNTNDPVTNIAYYDFNVTREGDYKVWGRVVTPHDNADSFWVRMDDTEDWFQWSSLSHSNDWLWSPIHIGSDSGNIATFYLTAGLHRLAIAVDEDAAQLDKLLITNGLIPPSGLGGTDPATQGLGSIELPATVRDFHDYGWVGDTGATTVDHPDFERYSGSRTGLVKPDLGNDGKPVFDNVGSTPVLTSEDDFDLWWNDDLAYNRRIETTMHLLEDPTRSGVYQFVGSSTSNSGPDILATTHEFYPIDGLGFSEDDTSPDYEAMDPDQNNPSNYRADEILESHNYGFTTELHGEFTYKAGLYFNTLQADDDLWIFINGRLATDLGGVHSALSSNLDLAAWQLANGMTLVPGTVYSFDLFFAERHTVDSHLVFETNIELHPVQVPVNLVEDDRLITSDGTATTIVVPASPDAVRVDFSNLVFDSAGNPGDVNDAFEILVLNPDGSPILDNTGRPALPTIGPNSNAQFNITQGAAPLWSEGVELRDKDGNLIANPSAGINEGQVLIGISGLAPNTTVQLVARLVNNDSDNTSSAKVTFLSYGQGAFSLSPGGGQANAAPAAVDGTAQVSRSINFGVLNDVSTSFSAQFGLTTSDAADDTTVGAELNRIATRLSLKKRPSLAQLRGDLLLAVRPPLDQDSGQFIGTQLLNYDGRLPIAVAGLPAGTPFVRLSNLLPSTNGFYTDATIDPVELLFSQPGNARFDFDWLILGELNDAPTFVSDPYSATRGAAYPIDEPLTALEIVPDKEFRYQPVTQDPNGDRVRIEIIAGPVDTAIDTDGDTFEDTIAWTPTASDEGVQQFVLRAIDEFGAYDPANDQTIKVRVLASATNRPPHIITPPVTTATYGEEYTYDADAFDPDGDELTYSGALGAYPVQYTIPIGSYYTGTMSFLTLDNDDGSVGGQGMFSNTRLYEPDSAGDPQVLKFNGARFADYGPGGTGGAIEVLGDGSVVRLTGNIATAYQLDTPYNVTADTVLAFTFSSEQMGAFHAIGLDNQIETTTDLQLFQVYGSSNAVGERDYHNYNDDWPSTVEKDFAVDGSTGEVTWNPPAELRGQWVHVDLNVHETNTPTSEDNQPYEIYVAPGETIPAKVGNVDLTVGNIDVTGVSWDKQRLTVAGSIKADVTNDGTGVVNGPFRLTFFEDLNFDGDYDPTVDTTLGSTLVENTLNAGSTITVAAVFAGQVQFAGAIIRAFVDSNNQIAETDETNNYASSEDDCLITVVVPGQFTPVVEWSRTAGQGSLPGGSNPYRALKDYELVEMTPVVGDLNKDGIPDIVIVTQANGQDPNVSSGPIRALDGATGEELWKDEPWFTDGLNDVNNPADDSFGIDTAYNSANFSGRENGVALGDIDGDGRLEIVAFRATGPYNGKLVVFEDDGTVKPSWEIPHPSVTISTTWPGNYPAIANLDHLGTPEIITGGGVFDANGAQLWAAPNISPISWSRMPAVADLDLDGDPEVIVKTIDGTSVFEALVDTEGNLDIVPAAFWTQPTISTRYGQIAVANMDADLYPEVIVVAANARLYVLEHDGSVKPGWNGIAFFDTNGPAIQGGAPTVADFDGDGKPEIGVAGSSKYWVIDDDGTLKWNYTIDDNSSAVTGSTVFDFEGDGRAEVVYRDEHNLYVFRVPTNQSQTTLDVAAAIPLESSTFLEMPIVADVDADGNAEIIVPVDAWNQNLPSYVNPMTGIYVFRDLADTWVPTRQIWNQQTYHITNINDDGSIPNIENPSWINLYDLPNLSELEVLDWYASIPEPERSSLRASNTYRLNAFPDPNMSVLAAPDLIPSYVRVHEGATATTYEVRVGNGGRLLVPAGVIVKLYNGHPSGGGVEIGSQATSGNINPGAYEDVLIPVSDTPIEGNLYVLVDPIEAEQPYGMVRECDDVINNLYNPVLGFIPPPANADPTIDSDPVRSVVEGQTYYYDVDASDTDEGQSAYLVYELPIKPDEMQINSVTGEITWDPTPSQLAAGSHTVMVRVRDGHGGLATQPFTVTIQSDNVAPVIEPVPFEGKGYGMSWTYNVKATDANGDELTYRVEPLTPLRDGEDAPTIDSTTGVISWTTPNRDVEFYMRVTVSDGRGGSDSLKLVVPVSDSNLPPRFVFNDPFEYVFLGQPWEYTLHASDDNDLENALAFSIDSAAIQRGVALDPVTHKLTWTPQSTESLSVIATVTDTGGLSQQVPIYLPVNIPSSTNSAPSFDSSPDGPAVKDREWKYLIKISDLDGDPVTLDKSDVMIVDANGDTLLSTDPNYEVEPVSNYGGLPLHAGETWAWLKWTPSVAGTAHITILASDGTATTPQGFPLPIDQNSAPVITSAPLGVSATLGTPDTYTIQFVDFEGDAVRFELVSPTPGVGKFYDDTDTNQIFGMTASSNPQTPSEFHLQFTADTIGQQYLTVRIVDSAGNSTEHTITLYVTNGNSPPTGVLRARELAAVDKPFIAQVDATDADGDTLDYSLLVKDAGGNDLYVYEITSQHFPYESGATIPVGMWIDKTTGTVTWTPTSSDRGQEFSYAVAVKDPVNPHVHFGPVNVIVVDRLTNSPPRISSVAQLTKTATSATYTYQAVGEDDENDPLSWTLVSGPSTASIDGHGLFTWTPTADELTKSQTAIIQVSDPYSHGQQQTIMLALNADGYPPPGFTSSDPTDTPPTISADPPRAAVENQPYTYHIDAYDPNTAQTGPITYSVSATWVSDGLAVGGLNGGSSADINWIPAPGKVGDIQVTLTATQAGVPAFYNYTLHVYPLGTNQPPVLDPAVGLSATPGQSFTFDVPASDPENEQLEFFLVDSLGNLVRGIPGITPEDNGLLISPDGRVTWQVPGDFTDPSRTFSVQVQDAGGLLAASAVLYTISVSSVDASPTIGLSATTLRPEENSTVGFSVWANDDLGLRDVRLQITPEGESAIDLTVGTNGYVTFQVGAAGTHYQVIATAIDISGNSKSTDPIEIVVGPVNTDAPKIEIASPTGGTVLEQTTDLMGRIYDPDSNLTYFSVVAIPSRGGTPKTLLLKDISDTTTFMLSDTIDGDNNGTGDGDFFIGIGNASTDALITSINPFELANDSYEIVITARDAAGYEVSRSLSLGVATSSKLGNFSLSFTDMTVAVGALPISVVRTYDSQNAGLRDDFGYGWSFDLAKGSLEYTPAGDAYNDLNNFFGYDDAITAGSRITVTLPGGQKQSFTVEPVPVQLREGTGGFDSVQGVINIYTLAFRPDPGQGSSLDLFDTGPALFVEEQFDYPDDFEPLMAGYLFHAGFTSVRSKYDQATSEFVDVITGEPVNFHTIDANLRLRTADGATYVFDSTTGELLWARDVNGNQIRFTDNSIVATDPNNIEAGRLNILRTDGLITEINDGNGHTVRYTYDANGDLREFYDAAAIADNSLTPTVTYAYGEEIVPGLDAPDHFLTRITNGVGVDTLRVSFNDDGTVNKLIDANDNEAATTYSTLPDGRVAEIIADAYNKTTEIVRDARGNIERRIQQTGDNQYLVTVYAYDAENRQTHASVPFETDALTMYTAGQEFISDPADPAFDPSKWQSITTYDGRGNLTSSTDASGHGTTYSDFDNYGNPGLITDALQNPTRNFYANGQLKTTVDAAGGTTEFGYLYGGLVNAVTQLDDDGRRITTTFGYTSGKLTKTTTPDEQSNYFVYDALGNQVLSYSHWTNGLAGPDLVEKTLVQRTIYDANGRVKDSEQYTLDGQQFPTIATDWTGVPADWTTATHYNAAGQVDETTDRYGAHTYTTYDSRGNVVEMRTESKNESVMPTWIVARTVYDHNGRVIFSADPYPIEVANYDDVGPPTRGTFTEYDDAGRVFRTARYAGVTIDLTLEPGTTSVKNSSASFANATLLSQSKTYFDTAGRVQFTISPTGLITESIYDAAGRIQDSKQYLDGDFNESTRAVDNATQILVTHTTYDDAGRVDTVTDPKLSVTKYTYDEVGRVIQTVADYGGAEKLNVATSTKYDTLGRRISSTDAMQYVTQYAYDKLGRLTDVTLPGFTASSTGSIIGAAKYHYGYDAYGNQNLIRDPMDGYVYPGDDPLDKETTFAYDWLGRQTSRTLPDGSTETMVYNDTPLGSLVTPASSVGLGQLEYSIDFQQRVTAYRYDNTAAGGGRLVGKYFYNDEAAYLSDTSLENWVQSVIYTYDALGRVILIDDSAFATTTTQAYDADGRLKQIASPQGVINYQYNDLGQLERTYSSIDAGATEPITDTSYTYDRLGRLKTVTVTERNNAGAGSVNEQTEYRYDGNGNLDLEIRSSGANDHIVTDYAYDALNRLDLEVNFVDINDNDAYDDAVDLLRGSYDYTVRADGQREQVVETDDQGHTTTIDWVYDELGRLVQERYDFDHLTDNNLDDDYDYIARYGFDLASNRTRKEVDKLADGSVDETTTYDYDQNDRLTRETLDGPTDTTTFYAYNGTEQTGQTVYNGIQETEPTSGATKTTTYAYDVQGRLESVTIVEGATTTVTSYKYNEQGVRVEQSVSTNGAVAVVTTYHIDPQNHTGYAKAIEEIVDGVLARTYAIGHTIISQASNTGVVRHLLHDGHGSTRALVDALAAVIQRYAYDAYGETLPGAGVTPASTAQTTWLFAGDGQYDPSNGLTNHLARWRQGGRFLTLDPFAGNIQDPLSLHKYLYSHGNPVMGIDPSGMFLASTMVASIGISLSNVLPEVTTGGLVIGALKTGGQAAFDARAAALILISQGKFKEGFALDTLFRRVGGLTFAVIDDIDTVIDLALAGTAATAAVYGAYHLYKYIPVRDIADSLLALARRLFKSIGESSLRRLGDVDFRTPGRISKSFEVEGGEYMVIADVIPEGDVLRLESVSLAPRNYDQLFGQEPAPGLGEPGVIGLIKEVKALAQAQGFREVRISGMFSAYNPPKPFEIIRKLE